MNTPGWYANVAQAMHTRFCAYFYAGALHRTGDYGALIEQALTDAGFRSQRVSWSAAAEVGWAEACPLSGSSAGDVVILWHPESVAHLKSFDVLLRQSRPFAQGLVEQGARVLIVSERPKGFFSDPEGSSIFADATRLAPPAAEFGVVVPAAPGLDEEAARRILGHAGGSVALAAEFLSIERSDASGNAKKTRAERFLREVLQSAISETGTEAMAALEHFALECRLSRVDEGDIPAHLVSVLENAGLSRVDDRTGEVELFLSCFEAAAREALIAAIQRVTTAPPDWDLIVNSLFTFERRIRLQLTEALVATHGARWRDDGLGALGSRALGLAQSDTHASAREVADLHAPLDWLLLDDLLDLALATARECGHVGGLGAKDWTRFKVELVPIRNRVSHMRLPREGDAATVRRALRFMDMRASAIGT